MDPNMRLALLLGLGLEFRPLELPPARRPVDRRADFVLRVDEGLLIDAKAGCS